MSMQQRSASPAPHAKAPEKLDFLHNENFKKDDNQVKVVKSLANAIKKKLGIEDNVNTKVVDVEDRDFESPTAASPSSPYEDRPSEHADKMFGSVHKLDEPAALRAPFSGRNLPKLNVDVLSPRAEYLVSSERDATEPGDFRSRLPSCGAIPSPGTAFSPRQ